MNKIDHNDPLSKSTDIVSQNIQQLQQLFPEVFKEGKIDWQELQATLGEHIDTENERFNFTWNGKSNARKEAQKPSAGTLRPAPDESVDWDTTQNLYIEGDNLEVLKLLQKSYHQKVKMIYIDPPYNTGKDFVYKDNYKDNLSNYLELTGQKDEEGKKLSTNSDASGRYHSNWLNMMYPRLKLARNLLKDDGVIFISIDDNEVDNLKKVCNEIFGEENLIGQVIWKNKYGAGAKTKGFIEVHEYILAYSKTPIYNIESPLNEEVKKTYSKKDSKFDTRGGYFTQPIMTNSMDDRPNLQYSIWHEGVEIKPRKQWVWSKERLEKAIENDEIVFNLKKDGEYSVRAKQYLVDENGQERLGKPLSLLNGPFTQEGTADIKNIFQENVFGFTKPVNLLKYLYSFRVNEKESEGEIYLDFFSGSGTSAEAIMSQNFKDNLNRKYILVQLPEQTAKGSDSSKAGYDYITSIGKERIRRVSNKLKEEHPDKAKDLDLGFKVFKLDSSNIKAWSPEAENLEQNLLDAVENIKEGRTENDLLFEILLKYGLDLTLPITEHDVAGAKVFNVGAGALLVCLADDITVAVAEGVAELKNKLNPEICRVVFKDNGFKDSAVKTNVMQKLKQHNIEEVRSI